MSKNLPARTADEILNLPDSKLTAPELEYKATYLVQRDSEAVDETSHREELQRIEIAHGNQLFVFPDDSSAKRIKVVILHSLMMRSFYDRQGSDEDSVLMCGSFDCKMGKATEEGVSRIQYLNPGEAACNECPASHWGSSMDGGKGMACKERRGMLVLHPDYKTVLRLNASTMSVKNHDRFRSKCKAKSVPVAGHWTELSLEKKTAGEQVYSVMNFELGEKLPPEQFKEIYELRKEYADAVSYDPEVKPESKGGDDEDLPF